MSQLLQKEAILFVLLTSDIELNAFKESKKTGGK